MALPHDYPGEACSLARTLEIVGERWTLLILRDAFYGVRRFGDFAAHLNVPRAVLSERLKSLTATGVLTRATGSAGRDEYQLTDKGAALWPAVRALVAWGDEHYAPRGPRRLFRHVTDEAPIDGSGRCTVCGAVVGPEETLVAPGPGLPAPSPQDDPVTATLARPHLLLRPVRG
ncbi:MAG TPA: helix-turn-helix domain-containing protein [Pseudonocardia sp.]|jgi:DNA-binding HxlR family transcriptional regulator|uniref:winged helix-turn-helix transcriptional regulator n=1 Tax=Pseudonocardia sp. TaxID=60912 RepID=UPI002F3E7689